MHLFADHFFDFLFISLIICPIFAGIRTMQDHGPKKHILMKRKKISQKKRQFKRPRDNEHLADVLETYEDNTITQVGVPIKQ